MAVSSPVFRDATLLSLGVAFAALVYYDDKTVFRPSPSKHKKKSVAKTVEEEEERADAIREGVAELVGRTPMVKIVSLSKATGCDILAKCEFLNTAGRYTHLDWLFHPLTHPSITALKIGSPK